MKSGSNVSKEDEKISLSNLLGEITDYQVELKSDNLEQNDLKVKEGAFIEKNFNEKLKYLLKAKDAFSSIIDFSQVHDDIILSINHALLNNPKLKEKQARKIIKKINKVFKDESFIQIDSFLPVVNGSELIEFFHSIKEYSFPEIINIVENKTYTVIMESTFCLHSQIGKKVNQLRKSFLLFSLLHKLYTKYPDYVKNYYKYFVRRYFLREKVDRKRFEVEDNELDLSNFGNFVFIIAINKSLKDFKETENLVENFSFKNESPDYSFKKSFEMDEIDLINSEVNEINFVEKFSAKKNVKSTSSTIKEEDKKNKEKEQLDINVNQDPKIIKSYRELNYLISHINKEQNCIANIIYLDTYMNVTTPKCVIAEKFGKFMEKQKAINIALIDFIHTKFPEFDISKLEI
jgi:hypothetical protein